MGHRASVTVTKTTIGFSTGGAPEVKPTTEDLISSLSAVPCYSVLFKDTQTAIFSEGGPLPIPTRHFIALLASRATHCPRLSSLEESLFLSTGGDKSWLEQRNVPTKLKKLEEINLLLCTTPRLLTTDHIKKLTDGDESFSITEVVQALVILIHIHGLSSFVKSVGLDQLSHGTGRLQKINERKSIEFLDIVDKSLDQKNWRSVQKELKRKRSFSEGEISTNTQSKVSQNSKRQASQTGEAKLNGDIRIQDYSWDDQGFSVLSTFYHDLAVILDDKFRTAKCIVNKSESSSKLHRAVWSYVQSLLGVHYDDYNYQEIDSVLDQASQEYIRGCCGQGSSRPPLAHTLFSVLPHQHIIQLSVIVMEARNLSEILFVLKSVMKYMS